MATYASTTIPEATNYDALIPSSGKTSLKAGETPPAQHKPTMLAQLFLIAIFVFVIVLFAIAIDFISKASANSFTSATRQFIIWSSIAMIFVFFYVGSTEIYKLMNKIGYEGKNSKSKGPAIIKVVVSIVLVIGLGLLLHLVALPKESYAKNTTIQKQPVYDLVYTFSWIGLVTAGVVTVMLFIPLVKEFQQNKKQKKIAQERKSLTAT